MGFFNFWKKSQSLSAEKESAFFKAATSNVINRRAHVRVKYPEVGPVGFLPKVFINNEELKVIDISVGGIQLASVSQIAETGQIIELKFIWPPTGKESTQKSQLLRAKNGLFHLKFLDPESSLVVGLSLALKSGHKGAQTRCLSEIEIPKDKDVIELWMAASGEMIMFCGKRELTEARIHFGSMSCAFYPRKGLYLGEKDSNNNWRYEKLPQKNSLDEILLFLVNIRKPSSLIMQYQKLIEKYYK